MGNFYTNFTLRGVKQAEVVKALAGRSAFVTPERDGCVVVFDEECEDQDMDLIAQVGNELSKRLDCPVLAVLNHDDDIFWCQLQVSGKLEDEYDSSPDYFETTAAPRGPTGGDASKLCKAFGSAKADAAEEALRSDAYVFAVERHAALAEALGIPEFGVGGGFRYIEGGEIPGGLEEADLVRVK